MGYRIKKDSVKGTGVKDMPYGWVNRTLIIGMTVICLVVLPLFSIAMESQNASAKPSSPNTLAELKRRAAVIWGSDNVWIPAPSRKQKSPSF